MGCSPRTLSTWSSKRSVCWACNLFQPSVLTPLQHQCSTAAAYLKLPLWQRRHLHGETKSRQAVCSKGAGMQRLKGSQPQHTDDS